MTEDLSDIEAAIRAGDEAGASDALAARMAHDGDHRARAALARRHDRRRRTGRTRARSA